LCLVSNRNGFICGKLLVILVGNINRLVLILIDVVICGVLAIMWISCCWVDVNLMVKAMTLLYVLYVIKIYIIFRKWNKQSAQRTTMQQFKSHMKN
jgi:hypothetical protein